MDSVSTLFSGSSGNSCYIGSSDDGILIDAGRNFKAICEGMKSLDFPVRGIRAVFITHAHDDHISALRVFVKKMPDIPIFATAQTIDNLMFEGIVGPETMLCPIDEQGIGVGRFFVTPFVTPHDCPGSCGYVVETDSGGHIGVCTDLGHRSDTIVEALSGCKTIVIESNHDENILRAGNYPYWLKMRILGAEGHLSNRDCASLSAILLHSGTKNFVLAHLSRENNLPDVAYDTVSRKLCECGAEPDGEFGLHIAPALAATRHFSVL